jgi:hypothetical protein
MLRIYAVPHSPRFQFIPVGAAVMAGKYGFLRSILVIQWAVVIAAVGVVGGVVSVPHLNRRARICSDPIHPQTEYFVMPTGSRYNEIEGIRSYKGFCQFSE